jgi:hypothetical protein
MITQQQLDGYLGKPISEMCRNGFVSAADDHGAHFVAHVLACASGITCQTMSHGKHPGVSIRVQEMFRRCRSVGVWALRPAALTSCFVFITNASSVHLATKVMNKVPRQHVGIYFGGFVWHYSNSQQKVVKQTPAQFAVHYPSPDNAMFYGSLP